MRVFLGDSELIRMLSPAIAALTLRTASGLIANGVTNSGPLHDPGEGAYYTLDPADVGVITEAASNGE